MIVRYHKIVFGVGRSLILSKETLPYELIKTHNCFILFYKNCNSHLIVTYVHKNKMPILAIA